MTDKRAHPDAAEIAPMYDRLFKITDDHLDDPTTAEITTYADGTFNISVFHRRSLDEREVLLYHVNTGPPRGRIRRDGRRGARDTPRRRRGRAVRLK